MRILWISHLLPYPPKGGVQQRSYHLLRQASRRHHVDFVGLAQPAHQKTPGEVDTACAELANICSSTECFQLRSDLAPFGRQFQLARSLFSSSPFDVNWLANNSLDDHLRNRDFNCDLVHVDTVGLSQYLHATGDRPFVLNHHNIESQMMSERADKEDNPLKKLYLRRESRKLEDCEKTWARRAAVNLLVSELDETRLKRRTGGVNTEIVRNGVDVEYFQPRTTVDEHDQSLIFVGGMSWWPNRDAALWFIREIWPELRRAGHERPVTFIGRDPPPEFSDGTNDSRIQAPGFVDDIRPAVDRAFAYVCPIRKGGGTRLKVLDALAMAKPLVATSFAVEGLGLEDGVHYLRADRPDDYVEQIGRLASDSDLRRRLARNGRNFVVENYAWEAIGKDLDRAYRRAVEV